MSTTVEQHRSEGPHALRIAVVTVSDTRTTATDTSGDLAASLAEAAGHAIVGRAIVPDEPEAMRTLLRGYDPSEVHAVLMTGGTGISARDQTYETVSALLTKHLPGYGELFRMLSYEEIGTACLLSRATGGLMGEVVVLTMPGSTAAVRTAMTRVILPELAHIVREARKH
ncbi:MogA/MoaB family molybdenum cofactor biosynthesis protein [Tundrisphaera sp. TA3]|uniref:MogA/MoaB family molybdenum cofactor biosynthesis protein n=1 Tax=Tundrisphaera sp. TA3 TaxID=3435775 RepID=UPI003EB92D74